ncbi:Hypothetical_protein [Hexamita inflata]|uniref:Hypothetical_protein n=1 Tax=Hexamita inflata TaxID=28002 RepID=A0ABP1J667_9EUKA
MTEESSESNSSEEISMCSFASQLSQHSEEKYYKEEYYVINDLRYKKDKESYIFKVLYAEKTESYDYNDENRARDTVTVNHSLINSKPYRSMGIYCQGAFQLFDFSNLSQVTKDIHKVSVVEGFIDLSLLKGSIQCLKLTNCRVQNIWNPAFRCEELQVTSRYNDISWLKHVKCERIKWQYLFVEADYELKMNYDNLVNVSFNQTTVDLSLLHIKVYDMKIKCCDIVDYATKNLIVENLSIIRSDVFTSQLMNAKIYFLKLENIFEGFETMRKYRMLDNYNPTIIDKLPDVQNLIIDLCEFQLKTFSIPKVNTLKLFVVDENISFRFFKNIQHVKTKTNLKYLKEFQQLQLQNESIVFKNIQSERQYSENIRKNSKTVEQNGKQYENNLISSKGK